MRRPARTVEVQEHGSVVADLSSTEAYELQRQAAGKLDVSPADAQSRWTITAGHHVGILTTRTVHVVITPKLPVHSILALLEDGPHHLGPESGGHRASANLSAAVAAIYAAALEQALLQGVAQRYRQRAEPLHHVQGRFDITRTARSGGLPLPAHCLFDERSVDSILNRTLKEAAVRAGRIPGVSRRSRTSLLRSISILADAGTYTAADAAGTILDRTETGHRTAYMLARTLIEGGGADIGGYGLAAPTFLLDMNHLFQAYLTRRIRSSLPPELSLRTEARTPFDREGTLQMRPDILITQEGRPVAVADIKYKDLRDGVAAGDLYQMSAYMTALGLNSGMLIHAGRGDDREMIVAGTGARIRIAAVDLAGSVEEAAEQVRTIARRLCGETRHAAS